MSQYIGMWGGHEPSLKSLKNLESILSLIEFGRHKNQENEQEIFYWTSNPDQNFVITYNARFGDLLIHSPTKFLDYILADNKKEDAWVKTLLQDLGNLNVEDKQYKTKLEKLYKEQK